MSCRGETLPLALSGNLPAFHVKAGIFCLLLCVTQLKQSQEHNKPTTWDIIIINWLRLVVVFVFVVCNGFPHKWYLLYWPHVPVPGQVNNHQWHKHRVCLFCPYLSCDSSFICFDTESFQSIPSILAATSPQLNNTSRFRTVSPVADLTVAFTPSPAESHFGHLTAGKNSDTALLILLLSSLEISSSSTGTMQGHELNDIDFNCQCCVAKVSGIQRR